MLSWCTCVWAGALRGQGCNVGTSVHTVILRLAHPTVNPYVHIYGVARSFARGARHSSSLAFDSFNINVMVGGGPWGVCEAGALGPGGEAGGP